MGNGETHGRRAQMDRFIRRMIKSGADPKKMQIKARECAVRADRNETNAKPKG